MTGISVKQDGPIVKFLPKHDERIGYGFVTVFRGGTLLFLPNISPGRATLTDKHIRL